MAFRARVVGVQDFQALMRDLPVRTERGRRRLLWQAARKVRTPVRRQMRNNIRARARGHRGGLRRSLRITIGTSRRPVFVVRGRNYLVPYNARTQAISSELRKLPALMEEEMLKIYQEWLRRRTR